MHLDGRWLIKNNNHNALICIQDVVKEETCFHGGEHHSLDLEMEAVRGGGGEGDWTTCGMSLEQTFDFA